MSGIVAHLSLDGRPPRPDIVEAMAARAAFRGVDGFHIWKDGPIALGQQTLLAVPEAVAGPETYSGMGRRLVIALDGLLYNRDELLAALGSDAPGSAAAVPTDAIIIAAAWARWGRDALARLQGDYAFVIWDASATSLVAAVDFLGLRQLHYHQGSGSILFATEEGQLLAAPWVGRDIDARVLRAFLIESFPPDGRTCLREIRRLPEASALEVAPDGTPRLWRYWTPRAGQRKYRREEEWVEEFRWILRDAVKVRMRAPGAVACWMSGGVDSGALASIAGHGIRSGEWPSSIPPLHCITGTFEGKDCDETEYASMVTRQYALPHDLVPIRNERMFETLARAMAGQGTPFVSFDQVFAEKITAAIEHADCRACLLGLGGDEITGSQNAIHNLIPRFRLRRGWHAAKRNARMGQVSVTRILLGVLARQAPPRLYWSLRPNRRAVRRFLTPDAQPGGRVDAWLPPDSILSTMHPAFVWSRLSTGGLANEMNWRDRLAARRRTELRYPFLDQRLMEFMLDVPDALLFQNDEDKVILRRAMSGILPEAIRQRKDKAGFDELFNDGFREENGRPLLALFESDALGAEYYRPAMARDWAQQYMAGSEEFLWVLWPAVCVELWLRSLKAERSLIPANAEPARIA